MGFPELVDVDAALDRRDEAPFASEWMRIYADLDGEPDARLQLRGDHQAVFRAVFDAHQSGELAMCVVDDLRLLLAACAVGLADPWLDELLKRYEEGRFASRPCDTPIFETQ